MKKQNTNKTESEKKVEVEEAEDDIFDDLLEEADEPEEFSEIEE